MLREGTAALAAYALLYEADATPVFGFRFGFDEAEAAAMAREGATALAADTLLDEADACPASHHVFGVQGVLPIEPESGIVTGE